MQVHYNAFFSSFFVKNWCWCTLFIFNKCFANWNSYYHLCSDCIFYSQQTIRRGLTMSELYIYVVVVVPLFLNFAGKLLRKWDSFCLSTIKKKKKKKKRHDIKIVQSVNTRISRLTIKMYINQICAIAFVLTKISSFGSTIFSVCNLDLDRCLHCVI